MSTSNDWRLTNQERYLRGVTLVRQRYAPANPENDHDHCEFCFAKFMVSGEDGSLLEGYSTLDRQRWVCSECFNDFSSRFAWRVDGEA